VHVNNAIQSAPSVDSQQPLDGRVALVTGGSRGVGAAVAQELAAAGANVGVSYFRSPDAAAHVVSEIERRGGRAMAVYASAADGDSWTAAAETIRAEYGDVDLLVSNAGVASRGRSVADTDPEEYRTLLGVHALGPIELIRTLLPGMRSKSRSDIVVISSSIVDAGPPNCAPYVMAKAAMEAACRVLAREEREHGVRVNVVSPGLVDTDMGARLVAAKSSGGTMSATEAHAPFGRVCKPADIGRIVTFLAGVGGEYITGQRVIVDGGGAMPDFV
jgi:NAD(P)-dependent dehydrogenase (short-subunit alcohol dehydrogenase family)